VDVLEAAPGGEGRRRGVQRLCVLRSRADALEKAIVVGFAGEVEGGRWEVGGGRGEVVSGWVSWEMVKGEGGGGVEERGGGRGNEMKGGCEGREEEL
jgi:hypothetical protein